MKREIIGTLAMLVVFAISAASAAPSEFYLVPEDSNVIGYCNTTEVELWLNATVPVASGSVGINYTYCCADIISYTPNKTLFEDHSGADTDGRLYVLFGHWGSIGLENYPAGQYHLGNFTIHCCNDTSNCMTDLQFVGCELFESVWGAPSALPFVTTDGTFTCGEPADDDDCLGTCYMWSGMCMGESITNVTCRECLVTGVPAWSGAIGESWENDPCPVSACGCTCDSMCWEACPECCDGIDNDGVNGTDWPADPKCACCIDQTETVDDGCSTPCVPELPTLALAGIGILGIALLARKRD